MPTLAQVLNNRPGERGPYLATVTSSTATTVTTAEGTIPNACGAVPSPPAGSQVVVFTVEGRDMAIGYLQP